VSWSSIKLGDTCDVIAGGTPKRSEPSYWGGDIPWVKISDMLEGRIRQTEETITRAGLEGSSAKLLPPGTLLVSIFATIGRTAVLECEAATNQAIVGVIPRQQGQFDDRFLQHSLRKKTHELQRQGRGVAQANINGSVLKATELPVPPLAEQKRIAGILDAADALRGKRREALDELDILLQSTFLAIFGDPVTNPKEWEERTLGELARNSFRNGLSPSTQGTIDGEVLTLSAITRGRFDFAARKRARFAKQPSPSQKLSTDTFLICRGNGNRQLVGIGAYPDRSSSRVCFPDTMIGVAVSPNIIAPAYLQHVWCTGRVRRQIERGARTTNGTHKVNQRLLSSIVFPVPPADLQRHFAAVAESVGQQEARHRAHLAELDTLFASLQSRAFQGNL